MDKPIKPMSLRRKEFTNELAKLINKADIPPILVIDILKDAISMLSEVQAKQEHDEEMRYLKDVEQYKNKQEMELTKSKKNEDYDEDFEPFDDPRL